jgi:hypothetical protein|nr:MAG TPA: minor tail protein [Caudoviricetes sp.]
MLIHNEVRNEIVTLIKNNIPEIGNVYNGRAFFTSLKQQLPAISVFLDDAECDFKVMGESEWQAELNISIFLPYSEGEPNIDRIAEKVNGLITFTGYRHIQFVRGIQYRYGYDEDNASWMNGTLSYLIEYGRAPIK